MSSSKSYARISFLLGLLVAVFHIGAIFSDEPIVVSASSKPASPAAEPHVALIYTCRVVEKESGNGIPNARVNIRKVRTTPVPETVLEETNLITDADGRYEVNISPEQAAEPSLRIHLQAEHDDYESSRPFRMLLSNIRKNEATGKRPSFEKIELFSGDAVTGSVVDPTGQPAAGVFVQAYARSSSSGTDSSSWTICTTDKRGHFRIVIRRDAPSVIWVIPRSFAVVEQYLGKQRGDLGEFRLIEGTRTTGRLVDVNHRPIADVPVTLQFAGQRDVGGLPVTSMVRRGAISDAEGHFSFEPLPPGEYRLTIDRYLSDPIVVAGTFFQDRKQYDPQVVVVPKRITLSGQLPLMSVELQAAPYVTVRIHFLDSAGNKIKSIIMSLFGKLDGEYWYAWMKEPDSGTAEVKVPHGLLESTMQPPGNPEFSYRYRLGPNQPLNGRFHRISLGTLNDDVDGVEIIRYQAPVIMLSAVDPDHTPVSNLKIKANYDFPMPRPYLSFTIGGEIRFVTEDNRQYRSNQMLPDEEVTLTISAEGYEPVEEKVRLKESETKELKVTLKQTQ